MLKTKWVGAEEPTFFYIKLITEARSEPQYFISTEVDRNTPWRQVSSGTHMIHQQRQMPSGKNKLERDFQISKYQSEKKIDNGLDYRFG